MNRFRYKRAVEALKQRRSEDLLSDKIAALEANLAQAKAEIVNVRQLASPFAATFPDGSMLCQTIYGLKYFVDPDDMVITPNMVVYRQWEPEMSKLFYGMCTPDLVFVDVGANIGYFTCLTAAFIGSGGRGQVIAFEPNPKLVTLLRRNVEINWSMAPIAIHAAAVADYQGTAHLEIPKHYGANATLSPLGEGATLVGHEKFTTADRVEVDVVRLDDAIPSDVIVDVLKIDVEGHELGVLLGARETIARSPDIKIVLEWSVPQIRDARVDPQDIVSALQGFNVHNAEASGDPFAERHDPEWLLSQSYVNALLVKA